MDSGRSAPGRLPIRRNSPKGPVPPCRTRPPTRSPAPAPARRLTGPCRRGGARRAAGLRRRRVTPSGQALGTLLGGRPRRGGRYRARQRPRPRMDPSPSSGGWVAVPAATRTPWRRPPKDGRVFRSTYQRRGESSRRTSYPATRSPAGRAHGPTGRGRVRTTTGVKANFPPPGTSAGQLGREGRHRRQRVRYRASRPQEQVRDRVQRRAPDRPVPQLQRARSDEQIQEAIANPDRQQPSRHPRRGLVGAATDNGSAFPGAGFDTSSSAGQGVASGSPFTSPNADDKFVRDVARGFARRPTTAPTSSTCRSARALPPGAGRRGGYAAREGRAMVAAAGNTQGDPQQRGTIHYPAGLDADRVRGRGHRSEQRRDGLLAPTATSWTSPPPASRSSRPGTSGRRGSFWATARRRPTGS